MWVPLCIAYIYTQLCRKLDLFYIPYLRAIILKVGIALIKLLILFTSVLLLQLCFKIFLLLLKVHVCVFINLWLLHLSIFYNLDESFSQAYMLSTILMKKEFLFLHKVCDSNEVTFPSLFGILSLPNLESRYNTGKLLIISLAWEGNCWVAYIFIWSSSNFINSLGAAGNTSSSYIIYHTTVFLFRLSLLSFHYIVLHRACIIQVCSCHFQKHCMRSTQFKIAQF